MVVLQFAAYLGVDLGQSADYTTLAGMLPPASAADKYRFPTYQRLALGLNYPTIVEKIAEVAKRSAEKRRTAVVVDRTGVGRPVVDMLRKELAGVENVVVYAVSIGSGTAAKRDGKNFVVPKRDLIGSLMVLLESGRIGIAPTLQHAAALEKELAAYREKIKKSGHVAMEGVGAHDDLVIALALATWFATRAPDLDLGRMLPMASGGLVSIEELEAKHEEALRRMRPTAEIPPEAWEKAHEDFERRRHHALADESERVRKVLSGILKRAGLGDAK